MLQELTTSLYLKPSKTHVLSELAGTVASAVNADSWDIFLLDRGTQVSLAVLGPTRVSQGPDAGARTSLAARVARTREPLRIAYGTKDPRYPDIASADDTEMAFTLAHPLLQPDGELTGVLELYRRIGSPMFYEEDEEIVNSYLVWGGIALHYAEMYSIMARQRKLHSFLLAVVRSIFQDMISMDSVIVKIMTFAQKLVSADRASLFLVDSRTKELYARIFDVSGDNDEVQEVAKEISRFPLGTGIAGHVAQTGESLNIPDAYEDDRFNRAVDQQTGYTTKSLLCMPIFIRGRQITCGWFFCSIIGVMQMVNKTTGTFNKADEEAFATFATYCGLALHHAKLYDKIRRSEQKYKVALEVLSYHATCTEEEVRRIEASTALPHPAQQLQTFSYSPYSIGGDEQVVATIFMFKDLFKKELYAILSFVLLLSANLRFIPIYNKYSHRFIELWEGKLLRKNATPELSRYKRYIINIFHYGNTNTFFKFYPSKQLVFMPYDTCDHQFDSRKDVAESSPHLLAEDVKHQVLNFCVICAACDVILFFQHLKKMPQICSKVKFNLDEVSRMKYKKSLLQAITMTACDLCASTKPWEQQRKTVQVIFEEFYEQGDLEKAEGRQPIPMMDRTKAHELPASQVGFLKGICIPCYDLLSKILPGAEDMKKGCLSNLALWEELASNEQQRLEDRGETEAQ
ncbi:unnamed protein product [Ixodes pacificus]